MKNKFIEQVTAQIKNKKARAQIEQELESHILDKIDYYVEIGYPYEEAERRATEEMGNPEDTALPLNALHKDSYGFLTLIGGFYIIILFFLSYRFSGAFGYIGYTENAVHYIKYDFISFGIFLSYAVLLIVARKTHNKNIPLLIIISFVIQIIFAMILSVVKSTYTVADVFAVFQPMSYAVITLISSSLGGYIESIFAYEVLNSMFNEYSFKFVSIFFVAVIVLWAVALYVSIRRKENMSSKHIFNKALNIGEKAVSVFIAVNFFIMCLGTVIAISELSEKYDEITEQKTNMIDFVLSADVSKNYSELLYDMQNAGFNMSRDVKYDRISHDPSYDKYIFGEDINNISLMTYDDGDIRRIDDISYNITADNTIFSKNFLCYADNMKTLQDIKVGTTLDEVLQTGLVQKASYIQKSIVNGEEEIYFHFTFDDYSVNKMIEETGDFYYYHNESLTIRNGIVIDGTQAEEISMMRHTKYNMIKFIVSESQMKWDDSTGRSAESVLRLARDNELELELSPQSEKMKKKFYYYVPDQFNSILMYVDEDSKNYSFEYYNMPEYGFISMRGDETFDGVDISEFDAITDGMTLEEYKLAYDWGMTCAGIVRSSSEYDENTQRYVYTLQFIYPLKDGDNINQYIVEFYDGMLTKHYKNDESFFSIGYPAVD